MAESTITRDDVRCHCVSTFGPNPECGACGGSGCISADTPTNTASSLDGRGEHSSLEARAREMLAAEYEAFVGEGPYPSYAQLARTGTGSFTLCSIRAVAKALASTPSPDPAGAGGDLGELERLSAGVNSAEWWVDWVVEDGSPFIRTDGDVICCGVEQLSNEDNARTLKFICAVVNALRSGQLVASSQIQTDDGTGATHKGSGSQATPEAPSDLRPSGVDPSRILGLPSNSIFDSLDNEGQTLILNAMQERACEVSNNTYFDDYQQAEMFKAGLEELARQLALAGEARRAETEGLGLRASDGEAGTPDPSPQSSPTLKTGAMTVEGWEPLKTAPQDGEVFLVASIAGTGPTLCSFTDGYFRLVSNRAKLAGYGIWFWHRLPVLPDETALRTIQGEADHG